MSDAYCVKCGEPWDVYEFHDIAIQFDTDYRHIAATFRKLGCGLFDGAWQANPLRSLDEMVPCSNEKVASDNFITGVGAVYELLGDDMDGAIANIEDFQAVGLLE